MSKRLCALLPPPAAKQRPSPGKFHRYWLVEGEWPADDQGRADFAGVMARMVEDYGCDKQTVDLATRTM